MAFVLMLVDIQELLKSAPISSATLVGLKSNQFNTTIKVTTLIKLRLLNI
jgi:hypothetical protein